MNSSPLSFVKMATVTAIILPTSFLSVSSYGNGTDEKLVVIGQKHQNETVEKLSSQTLDFSKQPMVTDKLTDALAGLPGIDDNGQGGLFQVFSLRGASRWRVMTQLSGMPLHTERRAGAAASFVAPYLLGSAKVIKGPASTYYGSGAMGGMVLLTPRFFDGPALGYSTTSGDQSQQLQLSWGGEHLSAGFVEQGADNGTAANGEALNSHFRQRSTSIQGQWQLNQELTLTLSNIASWGRDIGKVNNEDFIKKKATSYPEEFHWLTSVGLKSSNDWQAYLAFHDQSLQTKVERFNKRTNWVDNESTDYSLSFFRQWQLGRYQGHWGLDQQYRSGVQASERQLTLASGEHTAKSILDASQYDWAVFADLGAEIDGLIWSTGVRLNGIKQQNAGAADISDQASTYFANISYQAFGDLSLGAGISTGFRFGSLTELYFDGSTGRGYLKGNPDLSPEKSTNLELSASWSRAGHEVEFNLFHNAIKDYIESVGLDEETRIYQNLTQGKIKGLEYGYRYRASDALGVSLSGHLLDGKSDTGAPLADIPADKVQFGVDYHKDNWLAELSLKHRFGKEEVPSGEQALSSANILQASWQYRLNDQWQIKVWGTNLLDDTYLTTSDGKSTYAQERRIGIQLSWQGD